MNDLSNKVSFAIITHNTKKIKRNKHLAPPSVALIDKTIHSVQKKVIGFDELNKQIIFNYHGAQDNKYFSNIRDYCLNNNIKLTADQSKGQKGVRCNLPKYVNTPYLFIVEHDWKFLETINLYKIIEVMEEHSHINYIRFNKRKNIKFPKQMASGRAGGDLYMIEEDFGDIKLCLHPNYSNNPQITRMAAVASKFIPIAQASTLREGANGGAAGFEQPNQEAAYNDYKKYGQNYVKNHWGLYCYGPANTGPYIQHTGE